MRKSGSTPGKGDVQIIIAERAYYMAERDGFPDGRDDHYWLEAEREIVAELNGGNGKAAATNAKPAAKKTTAKKPPAKKPASKKA